MLRICWIDIYIGPSDLIIHNAGTNFDSTEFRQLALSMAIRIKCVPTEISQSVGKIKRYYAPLRRIYQIITEELKDQPLSKEVRF